MKNSKFFLILFLSLIMSSCFNTEDSDPDCFNNCTNNTNNTNNINECDPDADDDGDFISNGDEGCATNRDSDGDGFPDYIDKDSDGDGVPDSIEAGDEDLSTPPPDYDGDGKPDYIDTDSDGDGVADGNEDRNGDGKLGNCKEVCVYGSEVEEEMCGDGQNCLGDGTCAPYYSFQCAQGETDRLNPDTDGDGVPDGEEGTFVCNPMSEGNPLGRKPVKFVSLDKVELALAQDAVLNHLILTNKGPDEAAICHDLEDSMSEVAGFTLTKSLETNDSSSVENIDDNFAIIKNRIEEAFGDNIIMRASGSKTLSHEEYPTYVNAIFDVSLSNVNMPGGVRNTVLQAILGRPGTDFQGLPEDDSFGMNDTNYVISITVQMAEPKKEVDGELVVKERFLVVQGGVTRRANYEDSSKTSIMDLDDFSNSTGFAGIDAGHEIECESYSVGTVPVADIIWVIDESGSMYEEQSSVAANAVDFFNRAISYGLDFRMGVVGVGEAQGGHFCTDQEQADDYFLTPSDLSKFQACVMEPYGSYPSEGASEYGITSGYNAIINHLPRQSDNMAKIRPDAALVVLYVSDERAQELKDDCGGSESGGMDNYDPNCMWNVIGPTVSILEGDEDTGSVGKAHAIIGPPPDGCDSANQVGQGYLDVVQYMGGQVGSVCQSDLGPTLQIIIEDIVASSSPVRLHHVPISLSLAASKDGEALERSRSNGFDYRASANALVFIGQTFDPNNPSEVIVSYQRWVTDVVPVD
ncbi:MAG: hypothetical protein ACQES9_04065 [Myxococcota bacterium]